TLCRARGRYPTSAPNGLVQDRGPRPASSRLCRQVAVSSYRHFSSTHRAGQQTILHPFAISKVGNKLLRKIREFPLTTYGTNRIISERGWESKLRCKGECDAIHQAGRV